jgi:hypothetical protein
VKQPSKRAERLDYNCDRALLHQQPNTPQTHESIYQEEANAEAAGQISHDHIDLLDSVVHTVRDGSAKRPVLLVYLDDIIIFSPTFEQHMTDLREVFGRLREVNIQLKASKCHFFQSEIKYLGHIVSRPIRTRSRLSPS